MYPIDKQVINLVYAAPSCPLFIRLLKTTTIKHQYALLLNSIATKVIKKLGGYHS